MLAKALMVLAYYVVAFAAVATWIVVDHDRTQRRVDEATDVPVRLADRFLARTALLLGLAAGVGAALMLELLLAPAPAVWIVGLSSGGAALVTAFAMWTFVRVAPALIKRDPLSDLRPSTSEASGAQS